jgi:UDP-glucose 4-epimerase
MKILVTGAGGLLGGRIIDSLVGKGLEIVAISRTFKGAVSWKNEVQIINLDLSNSKDLSEYLNGVSVVIHAAGMNASDSFNNPAAALQFNGCVTGSILQAAIRNSVKKFIYLSSTHVYTNNLVGVIDECSPLTNLHPYATSHRAGEDLVLYANQQNLIKGIVLRISNSFGYPIDSRANCWMLLVNDLCRQAIVNKKLQLNSTGKRYINFIAITELCKLISFLLDIEDDFCKFPIINVASKKTTTILEMARLVQARAELFFDQKIDLFYPQNNSEEYFKSFEICTNSLNNLGYIISDDFVSEIDSLLNYCNKTYGHIKI